MHGINISARHNKMAMLEERDRRIRQQMVDNVAVHMQFIVPFVLYEYMEFGWKKLDNCMIKIFEAKDKWAADETAHTTEAMLRFCNNKKISVYGFVKRIPQSEKLFLSDAKKGSINGLNSIESAILHFLLLTIYVLKTSYKMSNANVELFLSKVAHIIHLYSTKLPKEPGYVFSDRYIRDIFLEEQNFDMFKGEYV